MNVKSLVKYLQLNVMENRAFVLIYEASAQKRVFISENCLWIYTCIICVLSLPQFICKKLKYNIQALCR